MNKVNVALIGYGYLGKWHAQKIAASDKANLVAIVDPNEDSLSAAAKIYSDIKLVKFYTDVINEVDAFIVATPTCFHFNIVKELLGKSKHVFCEKPLTPTYKESSEIEQVLNRNSDIILQIGHSERVHAAWDYCEKYPKFFTQKAQAHFKRVAPFKGRATDVSVIEDLMIHDIDLAFYLFKKKVASVRARAEKIRTNQYDYVWADVLFEDGVSCTFTASRNDVSEQRFFEVINSEGTLAVNFQTNEIKIASISEDVKTENYEKRDHLTFEQDKFYNSILDGSDIFVNIQDALNVAKVMDAINLSIIQDQEILL